MAADTLSGWIELQQVKVGTNEAGAEGFCRALRRLMVTFGVPVEVSSDGGPEFKGDETKDFFKRWGIHHRRSSAYLPSSNGRAELAVKTGKRLLMENIGPSGDLNTDRVIRALLTYRNTPEPGCKLSPAQILLGRPLRDTLPYISKDIMIFNNPELQPQWKEAWAAKEAALKTRYVKTLETLGEHSHPLPTLRQGDTVIVQNQTGRFPNKWDKSGTVVETKGNNQYVVKVSGSGRLSLRNRRFLRKYTLPSDVRPSIGFPPGLTTVPNVPTEDKLALVPPTVKDSTYVCDNVGIGCDNKNPPPTSGMTHNNVGIGCDNKTPPPTSGMTHIQTTPVTPPSMCLPSTTATRCSDTAVTPQHQLGFGDFGVPLIPPQVVPQNSLPAKESSRPPRRPRSQRKLYDASTGKYIDPSAVPEHI